MATCPYCKSKMVEPSPTVRLSLKQGKVYEAILSAGPDGMASDKLMLDLFPDRSPITLRSCIYNINTMIGPLKIRGRGNKYYIQG